MKNKHLILLIVFLIVIKIVLSVYFFDFKYLHPDEDDNYSIAQHFIKTGTYPMTAFHGSGSILLYQQTMFIGISKTNFILGYWILTQAIYCLSVYWFYTLATHLLSPKRALYACILYCIYPSIIFHIGAIFAYENITTYLLIFNLGILIRVCQGEKIKFYSIILFALFVAISCLVRGHLLAIYGLLFVVSLALIIKKYVRDKINLVYFISMSALSILLVCITYYQILKRNEQIFGVKIISTQLGFEFLQGHNPTARGSWMGSWSKKGNALYEYVHLNIPEIDSLNEYEASQKRKELAIDWIVNNPFKEFTLTVRKIAMYFLPVNYLALPYAHIYNPVTGIVHILFLLFIVQLARGKIVLTPVICILLATVAASLLLTIVFFVGSRWRFYAEPSMILLAMVYLSHVFPDKKYQ
jgi:hypothetical protein